MFIGCSSSGQKIKPSNTGYAPVNGIKVYYEVYGDGRLLVLLHGAFYTIEMNWSQLIPELSKTRKVIAIEMQGHGHTPFFFFASASISALISEATNFAEAGMRSRIWRVTRPVPAAVSNTQETASGSIRFATSRA